MSSSAVIVTLLAVVLAALLALTMIPVLVWFERRVAGLIQDRLGPNRANIFGIRLGGLVQSFADVIKLVFKEEYYPKHIKVGKWLFIVAPMITFASAILAFMVVPFAETVSIDGVHIPIQGLPVDFGVFWYLALSSVGIIGIVFGGWLSHNKFSLLGALRASSQMLGYELPLGLSVIAMIVTYNSIDFNAMVEWQTSTFLGVIPAWGVFVQPLAALLFVITIFAETNRAPFNVAEGESEIVAGFFTEFSAMKFAMFFMAEYIAMNSASAVAITMFFGGYQLPWVNTQDLIGHFNILAIAIMVFIPIKLFFFIRWMRKNNSVRHSLSSDGGRAFETKILTAVMIAMGVVLELILFYLLSCPEGSAPTQIAITLFQIGVFVVKLLVFNVFFVIVRWTLPRFRYDQVQHLGWYYLLPLGILNVIITAIVVVGVG